ncbi:hypothetical protein M427DRAFT_151245 [Gonapodya prolifera JEL478]|uniref:Uncharacterized protein n=1 Tax=Gonapodya prolifera (strain JEL478) TaxID=1344416 RepID=A0A139AWI4_GONPJ|nr:hypothetical protein M427DRAFT_151245 [Gonapodya prolifera JEL478]|eukprot:KXS21102.1 hypothetical protein M427DRAFT_151245 [Gonapodya prolifera JEL478]
MSVPKKDVMQYLSKDLDALGQVLAKNTEKWRIEGWEKLTPEERVRRIRPERTKPRALSNLFESHLENLALERKREEEDAIDLNFAEDFSSPNKRQKLSSPPGDKKEPAAVGPSESTPSQSVPTQGEQIREATKRFTAFLESLENSSVADEIVAQEVDEFAVASGGERLPHQVPLHLLPAELAHRVFEQLLVGSAAVSRSFSTSVVICEVVLGQRFKLLPLPPSSTVHLRLDLLNLCRNRPNVAIEGCLSPALMNPAGLNGDQAKLLVQLVSAKNDGLSPAGATMLIETLSRKLDPLETELATWGDQHGSVMKATIERASVTWASAGAFASILGRFPPDYRRSARFGSLVQQLVSVKLRRLASAGDSGRVSREAVERIRFLLVGTSDTVRKGVDKILDTFE